MKIRTKKKKDSGLYESDRIKKKKKSRDRERSDDSDNESGTSKSPVSKNLGWLIRDRDAQQAAMRKQQSFAGKGGGIREIWLRDKEQRNIQFLSNEPIAAIHRYSIKSGGRFSKVTQPAPGDKDLFAKSGLRASLAFYYPVIDRTGYVEKKTQKRKKNILCFLQAGTRIEAQIERLRQKKGDITRLDLEYSRLGAGTDTVYQFFMEGTMPRNPDRKKLVKQAEKAFMKSYAPPTVEEQRLLLNGVTTEDEDDKDEDDD